MNPDLDLPEPMESMSPDLVPPATATQTLTPTTPAMAPEPVDPAAVLAALALALASAAIMALVGRLALRASPKVARLCCLLGIALGWGLGIWWLDLWPSWPRGQVRDLFAMLVLPAVLLTEVIATFMPRIAWPVRVLLAGAVGPVLLSRTNYFMAPVGSTPLWAPWHAGVIFGSMAILLLIEWLLLERLGQRRPNWALLISLAVACAGAGVAVMLTGYLSGGLLGLPLAAAVGGAAMVFAPDSQAPRCWIGPGIIGLFALLVMGSFFGDLKPANAFILFAAPLLVWIGEAPFLRHWPSFLRTVAVLVISAAPVAVIVALYAL